MKNSKFSYNKMIRFFGVTRLIRIALIILSFEVNVIHYCYLTFSIGTLNVCNESLYCNCIISSSNFPSL